MSLPIIEQLLQKIEKLENDINTISETVLWENGDLSKQTSITLSESALNFEKIEVYFLNSDNITDYQKFYPKDIARTGVVAMLIGSHAGDWLYLKSLRMQLNSSGTVFTVDRNNSISLGKSNILGTNTNERVLRIIGINRLKK